MRPADLLMPVVAAVAAPAVNARVVLKLADGREIDIKTAEHFCGLVVLTPAEAVSDRFLPESLEGFKELLEDYDSLTPNELRRILEALDVSYKGMAQLLEKLDELGIYRAEDLARA